MMVVHGVVSTLQGGTFYREAQTRQEPGHGKARVGRAFGGDALEQLEACAAPLVHV